MAWEIIEELMVGGTKYTWNFPSELKNVILSEIESNGNPYLTHEITSQIPNHSMHDWTIVDYPFTLHKGSDGDWQGGVSYTIGLGTYNVPSQDSSGINYELSNGHRAGASYVSNTNGTIVVFFAKDETTHQAAILNVMSAWRLSSDMNRISLYGYGTSIADYEQFYSDLVSAIPSDHASNGGGATHIAKVTGLLSSLSSNLSDILLISGGGGGGLLVGDTDYPGKDAGGISGSGDNSANQSTGYGFGQGEGGTNVSGGGSGLYGGYKGTSSKGGGAGSGYIGNSLVSNKKMVGYNVPTSDAANTKTESVQVYSAAPFSNKPKMGDGFARIQLIRESSKVNFWDIVLKSDLSAAVNCGSAPSTAQWNSDDILFYGESQKTMPTVTDGVFYHAGSTDYTRSCVSFPLKQDYIILGGSSKVNFIAKSQNAYHDQWIHAAVLLDKTYGKFLSEYAYKISEYPEALAVNELGLYESAKNLSSPQTVRRITVRFDYGTWEMFDIKVNILG